MRSIIPSEVHLSLILVISLRVSLKNPGVHAYMTLQERADFGAKQRLLHGPSRLLVGKSRWSIVQWSGTYYGAMLHYAHLFLTKATVAICHTPGKQKNVKNVYYSHIIHSLVFNYFKKFHCQIFKVLTFIIVYVAPFICLE